jgi:hypothetical protein
MRVFDGIVFDVVGFLELFEDFSEDLSSSGNVGWGLDSISLLHSEVSLKMANSDVNILGDVKSSTNCSSFVEDPVVVKWGQLISVGTLDQESPLWDFDEILFFKEVSESLDKVS